MVKMNPPFLQEERYARGFFEVKTRSLLGRATGHYTMVSLRLRC